MASKRPWQEPEVRSIDQLTPAYGDCKTGTTPVPGGPMQCSNGKGASASGACTSGQGAKVRCTTGRGVK